MSKLKEKIDSLYLILKRSMEQFPLTMITIIILTLIFVIDLEGNIIGGTILRNIMLFGVTFANGAFLTETLTSEKKKKLIGYIISAVLALAFTYIIAEPNILPRNIINWIEKLFTCSMLSIFALSIYFNYKKSEKTFEKYLTSVFVNILKASIIYGILVIGSIIVTAVFIRWKGLYITCKNRNIDTWNLLCTSPFIFFMQYRRKGIKIFKGSYKICIRNISNSCICNNLYIHNKNNYIKRHSFKPNI